MFATFAHDEKLRQPYTVITGYMAEMLTYETTRIGGYSMHRDELAKYIFGMTPATLADFLNYLQSITYKLTNIRKPEVYFKTMLIEYLRQEHLFHGDDMYDMRKKCYGFLDIYDLTPPSLTNSSDLDDYILPSHSKLIDFTAFDRL